MNRNGCSRPLDHADAEALAAGVRPLFASDAVEHAAQCATCQSLVAEAADLTRQLDRPSEIVLPSELADRVLRLRPFSRLERGRLALWSGPCGLALSLFCTGFLLLARPGISARDQAGLLAAATAPWLALTRACAGWLLAVLPSAPAALEALSGALGYRPLPGIAALLLLGPLGIALKRVLARTRR